jgi:hypothetical protein
MVYLPYSSLQYKVSGRTGAANKKIKRAQVIYSDLFESSWGQGSTNGLLHLLHLPKISQETGYIPYQTRPEIRI